MSMLSNMINTIFTMEAPWKFSTSAGFSGGVGPFGGAFGGIWLERPTPPAKAKLVYVAAAGSLSPLPASFQFSLPTTFSTGTIRSRSPTLEIDDMRGLMMVVGVSGSFSGLGKSVSIYFFDIPLLAASQVLNSPDAILTIALKAEAIGLIAGNFYGVDAGFAAEMGYCH